MALTTEGKGMPYALGALVTMKKQHPCGGSVWKVVRLGADVKLQCVTCGKYINLTKDELKRRIDRQGE